MPRNFTYADTYLPYLPRLIRMIMDALPSVADQLRYFNVSQLNQTPPLETNKHRYQDTSTIEN